MDIPCSRCRSLPHTVLPVTFNMTSLSSMIAGLLTSTVFHCQCLVAGRVNPGFDGPTLTLFLPSQTKAFILSLGSAHAGLLSGLLTSCLVAAPGMWPMAYSAFAAAWDTAIFAVDAGSGAGWFDGYVCRRL